ncbi:LacI family DNA-binding transcriptional regulator [Micromonosporaceae bacterium Da 78-11]
MAERRPKLADVARVAGVSHAAASRAINGRYGVSDDVRQRVRDVVARLGFEPHGAARAPATGRADAGRRERIEVLIVDPDPQALSAKPFYSRVLAGAMHALSDQDVALELRLVAAPPTGDADPPFGRILINMPALPGAAYRRHGRTIALGQTAPGVPVRRPGQR